MTLPLFLADLLAYSAQIAAIIAVGSALPYLFRLQRPGAMLAYRQTLLVACLFLPLLQPWKRPAVESPHGVMILQVAASQSAPVPARRLPTANEIAASILCAGVLARLAWLAVGLNRLRRRRRSATLLDSPPPSFGDLQLGLAVQPSIGLSAEVSGPVTFGIRNPVILLPISFLNLPSPTQQAIVCHEMTHIRRGDWAYTMAEELIRALFWFHPCVWWLLGQIHLTREQAVDSEVIDITAAPEQYVHALLAAAGGNLQADLAPAPLFLRKSHLAQRVTLILKGVSMSRSRLLSSLAAVCGALVITTRVVVSLFPISAPAQEVVRGEANLLHRPPILYPAEAIQKGIQGTVVVEATLNDHGVVTDAKVLSGPEELRKAALKSVLEWHYSGLALSPVEVAIDFKIPTPAPGSVAPTATIPTAQPNTTTGAAPTDSQRMRAVILGVPGRVTRIQISGVTPQLQSQIESRLTVHEGDELQADTLARLRQTIKEIDEHLDVNVSRKTGNGVTELALEIRSTTPMDLVPPGTVPQRIRVGGNVQADQILDGPKPVYPPMAKQARVQGTVRLNVIIGKDGTMQDIRVESGHPLLAPAALQAVKQWVYKPTLLNGQPVEVESVVDVNFTLSE